MTLDPPLNLLNSLKPLNRSILNGEDTNIMIFRQNPDLIIQLSLI